MRYEEQETGWNAVFGEWFGCSGGAVNFESKSNNSLTKPLRPATLLLIQHTRLLLRTAGLVGFRHVLCRVYMRG